MLGTRPSEEKLSEESDPDSNTLPDDNDQRIAGSASSNTLGVSVQVLTPSIARSIGIDSTVKGVVVAAVDTSSDAGSKLQRGDVIISANGMQISSPDMLDTVVAQSKREGRSQIALYVQRARLPAAFIAVRLKK